MSTNDQLTHSEKKRLAQVIVDSQFCKDMSFDDFQDLIGFLCEDIPGLECMQPEVLESLATECWSIYLALIFNRECGEGSADHLL